MKLVFLIIEDCWYTGSLHSIACRFCTTFHVCRICCNLKISTQYLSGDIQDNREQLFLQISQKCKNFTSLSNVLKYYIRDYVTKCNFLTYHVYFMCLFFMVLLSTPFSLFLFCNLFCMPIVICLFFMTPCGPKIGNFS